MAFTSLLSAARFARASVPTGADFLAAAALAGAAGLAGAAFSAAAFLTIGADFGRGGIVVAISSPHGSARRYPINSGSYCFPGCRRLPGASPSPCTSATSRRAVDLLVELATEHGRFDARRPKALLTALLPRDELDALKRDRKQLCKEASRGLVRPRIRRWWRNSEREGITVAPEDRCRACTRLEVDPENQAGLL